MTSFHIYVNQILAWKFDIFVIFYLDNIFIFTKNLNQPHNTAVWWILKKVKKHGSFANFKKCQFHKDKVCFLEYVLSAQRVQMKDKNIDKVKNLPEPKSLKNIKVFLDFVKFY